MGPCKISPYTFSGVDNKMLRNWNMNGNKTRSWPHKNQIKTEVFFYTLLNHYDGGARMTHNQRAFLLLLYNKMRSYFKSRKTHTLDGVSRAQSVSPRELGTICNKKMKDSL